MEEHFIVAHSMGVGKLMDLLIDMFMQLAFNMSNRVTDKLESSTLLIYLETFKSISTR
jgi:hypothetical protein